MLFFNLSPTKDKDSAPVDFTFDELVSFADPVLRNLDALSVPSSFSENDKSDQR